MLEIEHFHFLRPWWFLGFLPLGMMIFFLLRQRVGSKSWEAVCDAHLLPHLLVGSDQSQSRAPYILLVTVWLLCLLALAGPVWSKLPQPVFRAETSLVLVLDLSRSMDAEDVQPSRLTRAKHKVLDILKDRQEGQTALVVFSGEPYVVSPLTEDSNTIAAMVSSLDTNLMPVQGSRPDLALLQAKKLLEQSHVPKGNILLITDGIEEGDVHGTVKNLLGQHHRVSVLGVGTTEGAPIPQRGGFVKDQDGDIVIPKLNPEALAELAKIGRGRYATLTIDDQDLETVLPSDWTISDETQKRTSQRTTELWREEGPWIVLGIVALTIPAFRTGWIGVLFIVLLLTPSPGEAFFEGNLWSRPDQQGAHALEQDDPEKAATLFEDPSWKGVANYRAGNYQEAVEYFSQDHSADGHFNRGNALARSGQLQDALQAYQTALQQNPTHNDARYNYELIEKLLQQQDNQQHSDSDGETTQDKQSSDSERSESPQSQEHGEQKNSGQGSDKEQAKGKSTPSSQRTKEDSSQSNSQQDAQPSSDTSGQQEQANTRVAQEESSENDRGEEIGENLHAGRPADDAQKDHQDNTDQKSMTTAGLSKNKNRELESQQAMKQWLRRIPDDPGGLLRRKFLLEHRRRQESGQLNTSGTKSW